MTEHKFTDEEVIKALEYHSDPSKPCVYKCVYGDQRYCGSKMAKDALDLIKRQKAEIKSLEDSLLGKLSASAAAIIEDADGKCKEVERSIKAEAVKEFAERLKERLIAGGIYPVFVKNSIDNLVKEMMEGKE